MEEGQPSDLEKKWTEILQNVKPPAMDEFHMQCIYRVPPAIREVKPKAYAPRIISIGPYHHNSCEDTEELKLKYVKGFLNRTRLSTKELVAKIEEIENSINIRSCYADTIKCNGDDFFDMILVDACFIIELFLRWHERSDWEGRDPLMLRPWMLLQIRHDLMRLENQLPFSVLEHLYNHTAMHPLFPSFRQICFNYLKRTTLRPVCPGESPKHFTDLLRSSIISSSKLDGGRS